MNAISQGSKKLMNTPHLSSCPWGCFPTATGDFAGIYVNITCCFIFIIDFTQFSGTILKTMQDFKKIIKTELVKFSLSSTINKGSK